MIKWSWSLIISFTLVMALFSTSTAFAVDIDCTHSSLGGSRYGLFNPIITGVNRPEGPGLQATKGGESQDEIWLAIQTVPPLAGIQFSLDGESFETGEDGSVVISPVEAGIYQLEALPYEIQNSDFRVEFARWGDRIFTPQREIEVLSSISLEAGFNLILPVQLDFIDLDGQPVSQSRITSVEIRNSLGDVTTFPGDQLQWLQAGQVLGRDYGLEQVDVVHTIQNVIVDGSNVVNRGQQRFTLTSGNVPQVQILLYPAKFTTRDAFFGFPIGRGILLEYPDGRQQTFNFEEGRILRLESLARGTYRFRAIGAPGIPLERLFVLSRSQEVNSIVISIWDLLLVFILGLIIFPGFLFAGRPGLLKRFKDGVVRKRQARSQLRIWALATMLVFVTVGGVSPVMAKDPPQTPDNPIPLLAYYYIWFDRGSWDRAKSDLPMVGPYSSDEEQVVRQHVQWAKMAGIDGFIVSWKSTDRLNARLEKLVKIASEGGFKLAIIYQGLDFERRPLPVETISGDLEYFTSVYADHEVFKLFGKPLIIWSGTWEFTREDINQVTEIYRDRLLILASERHSDTYNEIADVVDGNAYYWSSVDPESFPGYQEKLDEMSAIVHNNGGIWIAPAAPGFDARLIEGTRVVERKDGETLIREIETAYASSPDAVGLISWNEFSENTHIEPSRNYGTHSLEILAGYQDLTLPDVMEFASSEPPEIDMQPNFSWVISLGLMGMLVLISLLVIIRRGVGTRLD